MRRSHSGTGGWRNENSRHYRSRNGGNSHFRPSRNYSQVDLPRFPPPSSRSIGPQFNTRSENHDQRTVEHSERNRYRHNRHNRHNDYQRTHSQGHRPILPLLHEIRNSNDNQRNTFQVDNLHINSMGDVDHRQLPQLGNNYSQSYVNSWPSEGIVQQPVERSQSRLHGSDDEVTKITSHYTGHRPPASDHYGLNPTHSFSTFDNSHSFSRSVDDTVDLVRRRLLNRNEPQHPTGNYNDNKNTTNIEQQLLSERVDNTPNIQQEQPAKKRFHREKHSEKSATIKNKIVHQLFKMDKEKIHKLMDNPNSSHKFEYAISSLITESQNSFNRHLRSTAEKSLCSTSAEFMQNDNNTIYEDTFLKQMQCILDPQDTVFLEDIKPIVMAELSKVLQIDELEQNFSANDNDNTFAQQDDPNSYNVYPNKEYGYEDYPQNSEYSHSLSQTDYTRPQSAEDISGDYGTYEDKKPVFDEPKPLFERRQRSKSYNYHEDINRADKDFYHRLSIDNEPVENSVGIGDNVLQTSQQYFDTNAEQLSEDDDPFAELDQQYHVAVDHDFIENDDITIPNCIKDENTSNSTNIKTEFNIKPKSPDKNSKTVIDEIDSQLKDMAKSPIKLSHLCLPQEGKENFQSVKELNSDPIIIKREKDENKVGCINDEKTNNNNSKESQDMTNEHEKMDNPLTELKSSTSSNSRKRSIEQRPSHRKEKRKKVETSHTETGKQILNKNIIINVNDCASQATEKCDTPKSIFNLFFSKEESKSMSKDNKRVSPNDKNFSEKHVRRKESPKKTNDTKKRKESTSSQSTSPHDSNQTATKPDAKTSLKSIDMFTEQPKKMIVHQAHRNTTPYKCDELDNKSSEPKISPIKTIKPQKLFSQKKVKRHVAVQVIRKLPSKQTQTEKKKVINKAVQTDMPDKPTTATTSSDAFERMKEIDLEIQVLLQEKFQLYNSLESKSSGVICIESKQSGTNTLGMTLLNVTPNELEEEAQEVPSIYSEDVIVDDFTNMPVEDLEQIALESVEQIQTPKTEHRNRSRKVSRQDSIQSCSSTTVGKRRKKKSKSPNISLIEQIITDDRPLEDIISLDDLEMLEPKTKAKPQRKAVKKKGRNKGNKVKPAPSFKIKDCSVVLLRQDISYYLKQNLHAEYHVTDNPKVKQCTLGTPNEVVETGSQCIDEIHHDETVFEETIANDIQIDMLDVSEDIVVGDCEVKYVEDKAVESVSVPISEEIILDNSQSSMEDVPPASNQGDECKVYDYSADENLRRDSVVVSGNGDAVLAIECMETNFLAACLDGNVYYFTNEGQLITTLRGSNLAVTCLTIVKEKHGTTVYTGSLDSRIRYYDLETGLEKGPECNVLSPIQTMDRAWDTVFVGTRTGFVLQFECKNNMLIPVSSVKFSEQSILALRAMKEGPRKVLLVAARSENVTIKDAQTGLLLRTLDGPKMTVYTLLYEDGKVYCGTSSHQIQVFEYTSGSHVGTHEGGKGAVCLRATGGLLFAGCYDGCVYVYREGEGQPFAQIRGPSLMLLSLAVVGSKIIAGYKDRSLYIWKIPLCILQEMIL